MKEALQYLLVSKANLGGTEMLAPLKEIYSGQLQDDQFRDIVLITDGEISNEAYVMELAKRHAGSTVLHTVGIGHGPNEFLIKGLARVSSGASVLIAPKERIEPKILRLFKRVMDGPVRNIRIAWDGDVDQAPREVVAFFGQVTSIFARSASGGKISSMVKISSRTRSGVRSWDVPLERVDEAVPIPVLWAREKIRGIEEGNIGGSRQRERWRSNSRQKIIAISRQYGILSSETSYVGIERRSAADQTTAEMALRKIPVMLIKGWGGLFDPGARKGDLRVLSRMSYSLSDKCLIKNSFIEDPPWLSKPIPCMEWDDCASFKKKKRSYRPSPKSFSKAPSSPPAAHEEDFLLELLSGQQANGGVIVADALLEKAGLTELHVIAESLTVEDETDKTRLFMTLATLLILEMRFQARRDEWEGVVHKSRVWLQAEMEKNRPTIDNQPLEQWLRDYLANRPGLRRLT